MLLAAVPAADRPFRALMEISKRCGVRGLACTTTLVIWMGTPVRAQKAINAALPNAPDAALMLTGAASRGTRAWGASIPSTSASEMEIAASAHRDPSDASASAPQQVFADPVMDKDPKSATAVTISRPSKPTDFNRDIYYRNKLEFSLETGWLPINIPFVFDFLVGSAYTTWPLHYTMVPNIASIRWHVDGIGGPSILRGNTDFTFSGSYTAIPRGAETRYFAFDYGIRQNFVQPRWRIVPYFEARGGIGNINAKGPYGVLYAQGQDMTFTLMMGSGARYNFNPRYSIAAGMTYMHVSNAYLSQPRYEDLGINVYGPIVGFNMRLGRPKQKSGG